MDDMEESVHELNFKIQKHKTGMTTTNVHHTIETFRVEYSGQNFGNIFFNNG